MYGDVDRYHGNVGGILTIQVNILIYSVQTSLVRSGEFVSFIVGSSVSVW